MSAAVTNRWGDLRARVLSGIVMVVVGAVAIALGGKVFAALALLVCAVMVWELATMTADPTTNPSAALVLAGLAALCLLAVFSFHWPMLLPLLVLPSVLIGLGPRREKPVAVAYALLIMLTGFSLVKMRADHGLDAILWLVLVVITSDLAGYFAGRILGGPKFWPAISPKKTWSGTVAGWIGAALIGLGFYLAHHGGASLIWLSPLVAFAGQMGDIAESWIKRRTGIKDSSNLIPGHGGAMDRFDALAGSAAFVLLLSMIVPLPIGGH